MSIPILGQLIVDCCAFEDGNFLTDITRIHLDAKGNMKHLPKPKAWRFFLPLYLEGKVNMLGVSSLELNYIIFLFISVINLCIQPISVSCHVYLHL